MKNYTPHFMRKKYQKKDYELIRDNRINLMFEAIRKNGHIRQHDLKKNLPFGDSTFYQVQKSVLDEFGKIVRYDKKTKSYEYAYSKPLSQADIVNLEASKPVNLIETAKRIQEKKVC